MEVAIVRLIPHDFQGPGPYLLSHRPAVVHVPAATATFVLHSAIGGVISNYRMKAFPRPADVVHADADNVGGYQSDVGNLSFAGEFPEEFPGEFPGEFPVDFPGEFIACPEPLLTMPAESGEALLQGVGDHELSSPDWLDVTHAMLEAGDYSGPRLQ